MPQVIHHNLHFSYGIISEAKSSIEYVPGNFVTSKNRSNFDVFRIEFSSIFEASKVSCVCAVIGDVPYDVFDENSIVSPGVVVVDDISCV